MSDEYKGIRVDPQHDRVGFLGALMAHLGENATVMGAIELVRRVEGRLGGWSIRVRGSERGGRRARPAPAQGPPLGVHGED